MLSKRTDIETLAKSLDAVDPSTLSKLGEDNVTALQTLSSRMSSVLDGTSDDNWSDDVKTGVVEVQDKILSFIQQEITTSQYIAGGEGPVNNLKTVTKDYCSKYFDYQYEMNKNVDKYEREDGEIKKNSNGDNIISQEWLEHQSRISAYESSIPALAAECDRVLQATKNYFLNYNFEEHKETGVFEAGSADITFDFSDYFNGLAEVVLDEWVGETETTQYMIDENGNLVEITEKNMEDAEAAIAAGDPLAEVTEGDHTTTFDDGTKMNGHRKITTQYVCLDGELGYTDGVDQFVAQTIKEEGKIITPKGQTYDYVTLQEFDNDQGVLKHSEADVTDEDGNAIYSNDKDRLGWYQNFYCSDVREYRDVTELGNDVTVTMSTIYDGDFTNSYSYSYHKDDPSCGTYQREDGVVYTYYRDEEGKLHETESTPTKKTNPDGSPVMSEPTDSIIDEGQKQTVIVTNNVTGERIEIPYNSGSNLDRAKIMEQMDLARLSCGYNSEYDTGRSVTWLQESGEFTLENGGQSFSFVIENN